MYQNWKFDIYNLSKHPRYINKIATSNKKNDYFYK